MTEISQRRRPGPKGTLSDHTILDAAQNLLSSGGAATVTVRGIAAQMGVAPNAVYTYFPHKAAVLRALVERLLSEGQRRRAHRPDPTLAATPAVPGRRVQNPPPISIPER